MKRSLSAPDRESEAKVQRPKLSLSLKDARADFSRRGMKALNYRAEDGYTVTVRVTKEFKKAIRSAMRKEKYSVKKKSLWISEALHDFFSDPYWQQSIIYDLNEGGFDDSQKINLEPSLEGVLHDAVKLLQESMPEFASIADIVRNAVSARISIGGRYDASVE